MIREKLAELYESEREWTKAAQMLSGIDLDSGIRSNVCFGSPWLECVRSVILIYFITSYVTECLMIRTSCQNVFRLLVSI